MAERAFQVDLRGVVDLLSRHLYSSPRVYLRELLQNGVDAITARRAADPQAPAEVHIEPPGTGGDDTLRVHDSGIGLTEEQVHELLATIGRSAKRDELGYARHEFLGQFGIGLLSGFLVADEVEVVTRSAGGGPTIRWIGRADGRYRVEKAAEERPEVGTTVVLRPRPGCEEWFTTRTITELAREYGSLLPVTLTVGPTPVTGDAVPWRAAHATPARRRAALESYCRELFGFTPLDIIDLEVPEAGLSGVAFVLPTSANPTARATHRVYLKRMLLAGNVPDLLPDWAFFVRCVVDAEELRPTASREALYEDDLLGHVREALGERLRDWLVALSQSDPTRLREFLRLHHIGVKALAVHDDGMLELVYRWLEFETSDGAMTLAEFARRHPDARFTRDVDEFRGLSAVSAAQGIGLVNGGYVYDAEIIERLGELDPKLRLRPLDPGELSTRFGMVDSATGLRLRDFLAAAEGAMDPLGCAVVVREYAPAAVPALYLTSRAAEHQAELNESRAAADPLWADVLGALEPALAADRPRLVLNHANPLTRRVTTLTDPDLIALAVRSLYGQALLHGRHPLRPADTAALNQSFLGLLDWAVRSDPEENT
ncbi:HSP90 family protein [Marinactinospora thermotolerans]|uniref:Molecular chaperone HtpG n=1 Tax=Marinactinospora thermotolerans DSM 45154 TaxID=1122192 RepID=A0A1T4T6N1_9ACTN|nr:HSP90 family protein [Marinactinospora thermotolerans]SKA36073.1 molecular chaperone HtpG [Marinactinospora thermotolerans DSM 45154]